MNKARLSLDGARNYCRWLSFGVCICMFPWSLQAQAPQANKPASTQADVRTALAAPVQVNFDYTGLWDALQHLQKQTSLKIHLDRANIDEVLLLSDSAPLVFLDAQDLNLDVVLNTILRPFKLGWTIKDQTVVITTPEVASRVQEAIAYDVSRLMTVEKGSTADDLAELVSSTIEPQSWSDAGGIGAIRATSMGDTHKLVVTQTFHAQLKIRQLLRKLAGLRAEKRQSPAGGRAKILEALSVRHALDFVEMPLSDVADYLSDYYAVRFSFDRREMQRAEIGLDTPITISTGEIRLESALNRILLPLGLTWTIRDEALLITTPEAAAQIQETEVYDVTGLTSGNGASTAELSNVVSSTIEPKSWTDAGGSGAMRAVRFGGRRQLVVMQSLQTHRRIQELLAKLSVSENGNRKRSAASE